MEDRHVVLHDLKAYLPSALQNKIDPLEHVSYYAIFDGHAGTDAAAYAAAHLHELVVESQAYPTDPVKAFQEAFVTCDKDFVATSKKSGSTAICILIKGSLIYTAWLGDSHAVLVRGGVPIKIVDPHKPNRDDERARITALGGTIMHWGTWRVNGQLAVSRAIGDGEYKPYISADPDVTTVEVNGSEEFLIVGCDGLWDTITPEEATEIVFDHLEEKKADGGDIDNISARLATVAKEKGSGDNITIIVIFLKPVEDVTSLGKLSIRANGSAEVDINGISSTSEFVLCAGGRVSLEPSKDKPDFTSPNVSFASNEGGAMFSPDPFGNSGGLNLSSENFDNKIEDKRFSNESNERNSDGAFSNQSMNELLEKQSIDKVDDLLKMLDREDSSPTPDIDDAIPLEEILAKAREQPEDHVDGVEDDLDSSDDEIVELRRNGGDKSDSSHSNSPSGNSQLDEVLKLDDRKLSEDSDLSPSSSSNGISVFPEPTMDPCEQVTVVETGPEECGTVVPPTQELPSHQQPVLEIVDTMTCSMVKEEIMDQDDNITESNGVGEAVTFEGADDEGFMLKTPGQEQQQLSEFTPEVERERETSVDTGESVHVEDAPVHPTTLDLTKNTLECTGGGLGIPNVQVTPATPTRAMSPEFSTASSEKEVDVEVKSEPPSAVIEPPNVVIEPPTPSPKNKSPPEETKPPGKATAASAKPSSKAAGKSTPARRTVATPSKSGSATSIKSASVGGGTKSGTVNGASSNTASKPTGSRPTSSTVGARKKTEVNKANTAPAKNTRAVETPPKVEATKRPIKPSTPTQRTTERKPLSNKPSENGPSKPTTNPTTSRTIPSKPKPIEAKTATTKTDPPKRPTSSNVTRPQPTKPSSTSSKSVSRQPSNASSTSSARPRPAPKATTNNSTTSKVAASKPTVAVTKAPATKVANTTTNKVAATKSGAGLSRSSSSATTRPMSGTPSRAATSTSAVKPTAAAARVAAARAAAKAQKPGVTRNKAASVAGKKEEKSEKVENGDVSAENIAAASEIISQTEVSNTEMIGSRESSEIVLETVNKNVITGEECSGPAEQIEIEGDPQLNGVSSTQQSSEC